MRINTGVKGIMAVVMWFWFGLGIICQLTRCAGVNALDVTTIIGNGRTTTAADEPGNDDPTNTRLPSLIMSHSTSQTLHLSTGPPSLGPFSETTLLGPFSETPSLGPFTETQSLDPFTETPSLGPFTETPSLGPFTETQSLDPFSETPTLGPFSETPSLGQFTETPSLGPFTETQSLDPFSKTPSLGPFTETPSLGPFTETQSLDPFSETPTLGPFSETPSLGPFTGSQSLNPWSELPTLSASIEASSPNPLVESTTTSTTPSDGLLETETAIYNTPDVQTTSNTSNDGYYTPKVFLIIMMCSVGLVILGFSIMGAFYIRGRVKSKSKGDTAPVLRRHRPTSRRGIAIDNPMFRENGHEVYIHGPGSYLEDDITLAAGLESFGYNTKIGRNDSWSNDRRSASRDSRTKIETSMSQIDEELSKPRTDSCLTEELGREGGVANQIKGILVLDGITDSETVVTSSSGTGSTGTH